MSTLDDVKIRTVRRWTVYECPDHGLVHEIHTLGDMQCPVSVKGIGCEHDLVGPIIVEEVATQ